MTRDNNESRKKANAVFFSFIMVISMAAVGFAAAPAAAQTTDLTDGGAENVTAQYNESVQNVQFDVDMDPNDEDNITIDLSAVGADVVQSGDVTSTNGYTIENEELDGDQFNFTIENDDTDLSDETIVVEFEHDLSDVENAISGAEFDITNETGQDETTATFDVHSADSVSVAPFVDEDSLENAIFTVDHSTVEDPHEVSIVVVDEDLDPIDSAVDDGGDPDGESTSFNLDLSELEEGDEFTAHAVTTAENDGAAGGDFEASLDNVQADTTSTVTFQDIDEEVAAGDLNGELVWEGQFVEVDLDGVAVGGGDDIAPGQEVDIRRVTDREAGNPSSTQQARTFTVTSDETIVVNTARLRGEGDYLLRGPNNQFLNTTGDDFSVNLPDAATEFELLVQDLDAEFADDEADNTGTVDLDIESLRNSFQVDITGELDGDELDDEELTELFGDVDGFEVVDDDEIRVDAEDGEAIAVDFDGVDEGDYDFDLEVTDSTAADSASITIDDVGDAEIDVEDADVAQGGVANITLVSEGGGDDASVAIGDLDDIGYQANVTVDFDGEDEVYLHFNTYAAGTNDTANYSDVATVPGDGDVTDFEESTTENLIDTGGYELNVRAGEFNVSDFEDVFDNPDNVGEVFIDDRDINNWNTWITPNDAEFEDGDEIADGIEAGNVTENDAVAHRDIMVHQIDGTGLDGIFAAAEDVEDLDNSTEALGALLDDSDPLFDNRDEVGILDDDDVSNFDLRIRETRDSAGPNTERLRVDVAESDLDVIVEDDSVFIVMPTEDDSVVFDDDGFDPRFDDLEEAEEEDLEFEVRFRNQDVRLLEFEGDDDDELSDVREQLDAQFDVEEAFFDFDQDPFNATNDDDVVFTGDTNAAPGTENDARVRSTGDTSPRFNINEDLNVTEDQTFEAGEFDLSETNVGDTYTVSLRSTIFADGNPSVDGEIVDDDAVPATFEVSDLDPADAEVEIGDVIDASATITNTGDEDGVKDVEFRVDGDTIDTQEVELEAGEEVTGEFEIDTSDLAAGDYEHSVWTEDDEEVGSLTIVDPDADDDDEPADDGVDDTEPADDDEPADDVDDDTPGFGALVALVALIAAALLATRRRP